MTALAAYFRGACLMRPSARMIRRVITGEEAAKGNAEGVAALEAHSNQVKTVRTSSKTGPAAMTTRSRTRLAPSMMNRVTKMLAGRSGCSI